MALCSSGCLGMIGCPQGACSSIGTAMYGSSPGQVSLKTMYGLNGMSCPNFMSNFHGFNGDLCICPTPITSISAAGTTTNVCAKAVSPNTFTTSTACSWLHPAAPSAPSLAGTAQNVTVDSNSGVARSGVICYTPSHCGARQDITFCQLAGVVQKYVDILNVTCVGNGLRTAFATGCLCTDSALIAGEYYCPTFSWILYQSGTYGTQTVWCFLRNGTCFCGCTAPTGAPDKYCSGSVSFCVPYGDIICVCTRAVVSIGNLGIAGESCLTLNSIGGCTNFHVGSTNLIQDSVTCGSIV